MQDHQNFEIAEEIRHWSLEERQEAGAAIAELEASPGWEIVCSLVEGVRKRKLSGLVADTSGREAAEYARALGEIHGLQTLEAVVSAVKAKASDASQELNQRLVGTSA